jgi:hypothetical protein
MPIGYQAKTTDIERIALVSHPDYWVEIVTSLERGAMKKAEHALMKASMDTDGNGSIDPDVAEYRDIMVRSSIVAWNLDGANGQALPITPENVDLLKGKDFDKIFERVNQLNEDMTKDERERFPGQGERSDHDGIGVGAEQSQ